ncbi:MAG TPA: CBS domain-containing protein [Gaiellaceae bacterium]|nr:CBS domain-containing protein [Gaiellaceae bacterium]
MNVREIMSADVTCISPTDTVLSAAKLMRERDVGALPVCTEGELVGIVTDRDIAVRYVATGLGDDRVAAVMTPQVFTIAPDDPLERAEALMAQHQVRRLPVCEDGRLLGILCQADLARHASHEEVGTLVEAISRT